MIAKLAQIGNSQGLRLPKALILKYQFSHGIEIEEKKGGIFLKPVKDEKLSWEETYNEMKAEAEDWSDWDALGEDGID